VRRSVGHRKCCSRHVSNRRNVRQGPVYRTVASLLKLLNQPLTAAETWVTRAGTGDWQRA
jgi:hypothetical protein